MGNPSPNGIKFFATAELIELMKDRAWLVKMTTAINTQWQKQNGKKCRPVDDSQNGHSSSVDLWRLPPPVNSLKQSPLASAQSRTPRWMPLQFALRLCKLDSDLTLAIGNDAG